MCMSEEGKDFILDLNMYLIMSGKSEKEVKEFIEEAEQHLILGEKEGKSVKDIFGDSPKEYAKSIEKELSYDIKENINCGFIMIIMMISFMFFNNLNYGVYKTSLLQAIGIPLIHILMCVSLIIFAKKCAFSSNKKFGITIFILNILYIGMLVIISLVGKKLPQIDILSEFQVRIFILALFLFSIVVFIKVKTLLVFLPFIIGFSKILYFFFNINAPNVEGIVLVIGIILMFAISKIESNRLQEED